MVSVLCAGARIHCHFSAHGGANGAVVVVAAIQFGPEGRCVRTHFAGDNQGERAGRFFCCSMLCIRLLLKVRIVGLRVAAAGGVSGWMKEGEERECGLRGVIVITSRIVCSRFVMYARAGCAFRVGSVLEGECT